MAGKRRARWGAPLFFLLIALCLVGCTERRQQALLEQAETLVLAGKYSEANDVFRRVVALDPGSRSSVRAHYKLGFLLETYLRDYDAAIFQYGEFLRFGRDPLSRYEVEKRVAALYFDHHNEPERAVNAYRKLLAEAKESLERDFFQLRVALSYFRKNDFDKARMEFDQLLAQYPKSQYAPRARFEIGNCYYMEGKYELAIEAFKQLQRHDTASEYAIEAQFLVAQSLDQLGRLKDAARTFEGLKGRYPSSEALEVRLNDVQKRLKQER